MKKDDSVYAGHMLDTARKALAFASGKTRDDYDHDETLRIALTHLLQVIGEAAGRVSPEFRSAHSDIPWAGIVGMRHRIVHDYLWVDENIVWDTVNNRLVPLIAALENIIPP